MSQYSFVTHWKFKAPLEQVWKEIRDMDSWPEWWKYVRDVQLIKKGMMSWPGGHLRNALKSN